MESSWRVHSGNGSIQPHHSEVSFAIVFNPQPPLPWGSRSAQPGPLTLLGQALRGSRPTINQALCP